MDDQSPSEENGEKPDAGLPPPDVAKPDNPPAANPATAEQLTEVEEQMSGFEKSTLRWAKTAVIMSGLAAVFVCAQWWEMHEGGIDTHNLATAASTQATQATNLATFAGTQATAASNFATSAGSIDTKIGHAEADFAKMAKTSEDTIKAAQDSMRQDQRAWVGISNVSTPPFKDENGLPLFVKAGYSIDNLSVSISNFGRSPALKYTSKTAARIIRKSDAFSPVYLPPAEAEQSADGVVQPGGTVFAFMGDKKININEDGINALKSGDWVLYLYGILAYEDVFKRPHFTTFCYYISPDLHTPLICSTYNDAN